MKKYCIIIFYSLVGLTISNAQKVGINIDTPTVELDIRPINSSGDAKINLGSFDNSTFLQLYSNLKTDPNPGIWWLPGKELKFHLGDPAMLSNTEILRLDGRTIGVYNTGRSIYIGEGAGSLDDFNARANIGIGVGALKNNTISRGLVAIGDSSLTLNSQAGNTAIGNKSMRFNTIGKWNTAVGDQSLYRNQDGNANVAIGQTALYRNTDRSGLVAIGDSSLYENGVDATLSAHATGNVAVGSRSLRHNTLGWSNTAIGMDAMRSNIGGNNNTAVGREALTNNTTGQLNTAIGRSAMFSNEIGEDNTAVGTDALKANVDGSSNTAVGRNAMLDNVDGFDNVAIGRSAMVQNIDGHSNTAVGRNTMLSNIDGVDNTAIGRSALFTHTTGNDNTVIGRNALVSHQSGSNNVAIGRSALFDNLTGSGNIAIGYQAGFSELGSNTLYIDNSSTTSPLIFGDFTSNLIRTNGKHEVTDDFMVTNTAFFVDQSLRRAGIGTINPEVELHVYDPGFTYVKVESGIGNDAIIQLTDNPSGTADSSWTIRNDGSFDNRFQLRYNNSSKLVLTRAGNMAIGTSTPANGYRLSIDGKIIAEELRVQTSAAWPDYVFNHDYDLMPLEILDQSIKENGHLPGIPKAEVIDAEGFDTGEMQRKMMEKIEELTLYLIDLKKENDKLKDRIEKLESNKQKGNE